MITIVLPPKVFLRQVFAASKVGKEVCSFTIEHLDFPESTSSQKRLLFVLKLNNVLFMGKQELRLLPHSSRTRRLSASSCSMEVGDPELPQIMATYTFFYASLYFAACPATSFVSWMAGSDLARSAKY